MRLGFFEHCAESVVQVLANAGDTLRPQEQLLAERHAVMNAEAL